MELTRSKVEGFQPVVPLKVNSKSGVFLGILTNFSKFPGQHLKRAPLPGASEPGKIFYLPEKLASILY